MNSTWIIIAQQANQHAQKGRVYTNGCYPLKRKQNHAHRSSRQFLFPRSLSLSRCPRLRVVPLLSSGILERAKYASTTKNVASHVHVVSFTAVFWMSRNERCVTSKKQLRERLTYTWNAWKNLETSAWEYWKWSPVGRANLWKQTLF